MGCHQVRHVHAGRSRNDEKIAQLAHTANRKLGTRFPRSRFRACLETCDFVRFVPEASETGRRVEVLDEAADILEQLERAW